MHAGPPKFALSSHTILQRITIRLINQTALSFGTWTRTRALTAHKEYARLPIDSSLLRAHPKTAKPDFVASARARVSTRRRTRAWNTQRHMSRRLTRNWLTPPAVHCFHSSDDACKYLMETKGLCARTRNWIHDASLAKNARDAAIHHIYTIYTCVENNTTHRTIRSGRTNYILVWIYTHIKHRAQCWHREKKEKEHRAVDVWVYLNALNNGALGGRWTGGVARRPRSIHRACVGGIGEYGASRQESDDGPKMGDLCDIVYDVRQVRMRSCNRCVTRSIG